MPFPDTITTTAAAFYGLAVAAASSQPAPKKDKQSEDEKPANPIAPIKPAATAVLPSNWCEAPETTKEAFRAPARFLQSFLRGAAPRNANRDEVAVALAGKCKGTLVAEFCTKGAYRQMVDIFCAIQQSLI